MNLEVRTLRKFLAERLLAEPARDAIDRVMVDGAVRGVQEWLGQLGILARMQEGYIESGVQMMSGAQAALIEEAGRR